MKQIWKKLDKSGQKCAKLDTLTYIKTCTHSFAPSTDPQMIGVKFCQIVFHFSRSFSFSLTWNTHSRDLCKIVFDSLSQTLLGLLSSLPHKYNHTRIPTHIHTRTHPHAHPPTPTCTPTHTHPHPHWLPKYICFECCRKISSSLMHKLSLSLSLSHL